MSHNAGEHIASPQSGTVTLGKQAKYAKSDHGKNDTACIAVSVS